MAIQRYREQTPSGPVIHCGPAEGNDYVLCGAAMDGEEGDQEMTEVLRGKIDCPRCIATIRFCKSVPAKIVGASSGKVD